MILILLAMLVVLKPVLEINWQPWSSSHNLTISSLL